MYLQQIKSSAGVDAGLLIDGIDHSRFGILVRLEGGRNIDFETLGNLVLNLQYTTEDVGGGPSLSEGQAIFAVGIFCFKLAGNDISLVVAITRNFEGDIGWGLCLDLQECSGERVVLLEQVVGGLSEILHTHKKMLETY